MLSEFRSRKIGIAGYRSSAFNDYIDGYLGWMVADGYSKITLHGYLGHIRAFATFLKKRRIELAEVYDHQIPQFLKWYKIYYRGPFPRRAPHSRKMEKAQAAAVRSLLRYLQQNGAVPCPNSRDDTPPIVRQYAEYLAVHRGLSEVTIKRYRRRGIQFHRYLADRSLDFESMRAKDIEDFVMASENPKAPTARPAQVEFMRGFIRYLKTNKLTPDTCEPFLPNRRRYALASLPSVLRPGDAQKTLCHVDRSTPCGKRDFAILQLLKTYGLRGGEVARLSLNDLDWRAQVIHIRQTKTRRSLELPLLPVVARAVLAYLRRGRPRCAKTRFLFVKANAPYRGMTTEGIYHVVARALDRAGVNSVKRGSHIFRHSHATELLRRGEPLKSIGDLLGHKRPNSTFWYCKLAVADLRPVALELPGGAR